MQFRLLNFHKMLANFAINLIGVFIPLIIYRATGNMVISLLYLVTNYIARFLSITLFKKQIQKYPQLFLLIRMIPMILYTVAVPFLDSNFWVAFVFIVVFGGMSDGFAVVSNEVVLNYSSLDKSGKSFGITRFFEQLGIILSVIAGGLILDNFSSSVVIIISISFYLISVFPLVFYYVKFRKEDNFNKEAVSNGYLAYSQSSTHSDKAKKASKRVLKSYTIMFFLMSFMDTIIHSFNLHVFTTVGTFVFASYVSAAYNGAFGLSSYFVGRLNEKQDTTILVSISCIVMSVIVFAVPFIKSPIVTVAMFAMLGGLYPFSSVFLIEKMLTKTRVLGKSNESVFRRDQASNISKIGVYTVGMLGSMLPIFAIIAVMFGLLGAIIPKKEEETRKVLVDFLHNNNQTIKKKTKKQKA